MKSVYALVLSAVVATAIAAPSPAAAAEIQRMGQQTWPGKFLVGVHPLGFNITFANPTRGIFKTNLDFAGKVADLSKLTIWLGGEFNVGGAANYAQIEPGVFVILSLEKLLNLPLVPYIRGGVLGGIGFRYGLGNGPGGDTTFGNFWVKVGGGLHYWITKNIGLGGETNFGFGAGVESVNGVNNTTFSGFWEIVLGARFAF